MFSRGLLLLAMMALTVGWAPLVASGADGADYDPLRVSRGFEAKTVDLSVHDEGRDRDIPVLVYLPESESPAAVVIFSHGLGGNRQGSEFLGRHWSARGYVAVFVQHPGSDDSIWKGEAVGRRLVALRQAGNLQNSLLRFQDIPAVIDQLTEWNQQNGHALNNRTDLTKLGMSGHSYGAVTTQAISGQATPLGKQRFLEPRIDAAIAFSPTGAPGRQDPQKAFGQVKIPWMLMTGTDDEVELFGQTVESRLTVFPALPPGKKYELVLHEAEHSAFTDRRLPGEKNARNPNHHRVILALSTAFWDAYLLDDPQAREWLDGEGPKSVLESEDRWQKK